MCKKAFIKLSSTGKLLVLGLVDKNVGPFVVVADGK